MKASELRKLSVEELKAKVSDLNREMFTLRFQLHTGHLENSAKISGVRKTIARVETLIRESRG